MSAPRTQHGHEPGPLALVTGGAGGIGSAICLSLHGRWSGAALARAISRCQRTAIGFTGDPTAPVTTSGAAARKNS